MKYWLFELTAVLIKILFFPSGKQEKRQSINERYERIKNLAAHRQARLNEAMTLHQFFRDIADEVIRLFISHLDLRLTINTDTVVWQLQLIEFVCSLTVLLKNDLLYL